MARAGLQRRAYAFGDTPCIVQVEAWEEEQHLVVCPADRQVGLADGLDQGPGDQCRWIVANRCWRNRTSRRHAEEDDAHVPLFAAGAGELARRGEFAIEAIQ